MNVAVCIKQVPLSSIPMDSQGNLDRSQGGGRLNPGDGYALEAALQIAEKTHGQVTALTMGPGSAEAVLKTAFSLGVSRGILLCDRAFAGADVYATAYTLAQAIRMLGSVDVIVCGQHSTDGDTAQLPSSLGQQLGIRTLGWVKGLEIRENQILVRQELSAGTQEALVTGPCLLAVGEEIGRLRIPTLREQLRAKSRQIETIGLQDLSDRNPDHYGLAASPTRVVKVEAVERTRKHAPISLSGEEGARRILAAIREGTAYV